MTIDITKLTGKQEKFCSLIAEGKNGIEAYMGAYNTTSRNVANVESTKLLKRDDITKRVKELRKPIENYNSNAIIHAREQQIDFITERIKHCKETGDEGSIIRYTDMLNKIHGLYKDSSTELSTENKLQEVDTDVLLKLVT